MANNDKKNEELPPVDLPKTVADDYQKVAKDLKRNTGFSRSTGKTPVKIIEVKEEETSEKREEKPKPNSRSTTRRNSRGRNTNTRKTSSNSSATNKRTTRSKKSESNDQSASSATENKPPVKDTNSKSTSRSSSRSTGSNKTSRSSNSRNSTNKSSATPKAKTTSKSTTPDSKTSSSKTNKTINRTVTTTHAAVDPSETGPSIIIRQTVAILIDGNNIEKSIHTMLRSKKTMLDFDTLIPKLLQNRGLNRLIYFREGLNISEKLAERLLNHYHGSVVPCHKSADIPLTITATQLAEKVDTVIILSGDSDYVELVRHMKSRGVRVEIAAVKRTTASILIEEADHYVPITKEDCFKFK